MRVMHRFPLMSFGLCVAVSAFGDVSFGEQSGSESAIPQMRYAETRPFVKMGEKNQIKEFLFREQYIDNLLVMENKGLLSATLKETPWSDSFWPTSRGQVARRWADPLFPNSKDWFENFLYVMMTPATSMEIDKLSPAEKYDLLVGDPNLGLTQKAWALGKNYHDRGRQVPGWAGLCHGWAPASFMAPNPRKSVVVIGVGGQPIKFYPSDLKALASLAWGESPPPFKFVGERCLTQTPSEDSLGRVLDPPCFDVNPATWHLAVVNQLGFEKRSFIFDATYDHQVWNYPVASYRYEYFNPQSLAVSDQLAGSMVVREQYTIDKFAAYRSPESRYVVGISMEVSYVTPTQPNRSPVKKSLLRTVQYVYDLELDEKGTIIGGEWYSNTHPDFIWNVPPDSKPISIGEKGLVTIPEWDGKSILPPELQEAAKISSARMQPLGVVVDRLLKMAHEVSND